MLRVKSLLGLSLMDFLFLFRGVFMAGLPHKVKLAINTKTYQDDDGKDFTVSMSVYDKDDFTGLGMVC